MINKKGIKCFQTYSDKKYWTKVWTNDNEYRVFPIGLNKEFVQLDNEQQEKWLLITNFLRQHSIKYSVHRYKNSLFLSIKTSKLQGGYSTKSKDCYSYINQHLVIDHCKLFDKWTNCPIRFDVCTRAFDKLKESIDFLITKEGYKASKTYAYFYDPTLFVEHHFDMCDNCEWRKFNNKLNNWCELFKDFNGKYCDQFKSLSTKN
jgi:hypothetical protein